MEIMFSFIHNFQGTWKFFDEIADGINLDQIILCSV